MSKKMMSKEERSLLIQRMLGLKHKLKVHDSMKSPETHDELSLSLLARFDLEDEIKAIENLIEQDRQATVLEKMEQIKVDYLSGTKPVKKNKL